MTGQHSTSAPLEAVQDPTDATAGRQTVAARDRFPGGRVLWVSWAVLFFLCATWVLANPLMASPDEPAHVVKAAAVVRGQWTGTDVHGGSLVQVPYYYNLSTGYPICYMFRPETPGNCHPVAAHNLDETQAAVTPAGRYNPLYYLLVGLPTLLPSSDAVLYAMRLLSAALCTLFLALGLRAVAEAPRPGWGVVGATVAITPMVVFLSSTVNPAAIEIAAGFSLWCQLLTLLRHWDRSQVARRMAWIAVTGVVFANARGLSLLYCALIVATVLVVSPWRAFVDTIRTRSTWPSFAAIVLGCVAALAWVLGSNSLGTGSTIVDAGLTFRTAAVLTIGATSTYLTNMIGQFGWMDTDLSTWVQLCFAAIISLTILLAAAVATRRERLGLLAVTAATLAVPIVVQASQATHLGIVWQGRYMLPIAVGIPVVAGAITASRATLLPAELGRRLAGIVGVTTALLLFVAYIENLHRYVNGVSGSWLYLRPDAWIPPVPLPLSGALGLAAVVAYAALVRWIAARPDRAAR